MIKYNCSYPGCYTLVDEPRSYCERHKAYWEMLKAKRLADAKAHRWAGAERPNDMLYNTAEWRKLSKQVRQANPLCARCDATEDLAVHHIIPPKGDRGLFFDPENLVVLCKECHDRVTSAENKRK